MPTASGASRRVAVDRPNGTRVTPTARRPASASGIRNTTPTSTQSKDGVHSDLRMRQHLREEKLKLELEGNGLVLSYKKIGPHLGTLSRHVKRERIGALETLFLDNNLIRDFKLVDEMPHLKELYLDSNEIEGAFDCSLSSLSGLETLSLASNRISAMMNAGQFRNIQVLNLSRNKMTSLNGFAGLELCKTLERLSVSYNQISHMRDISVLSSFCRLRSLDLRGNPIGTSTQVNWMVLKSCPTLKHFNAAPVAEYTEELKWIRGRAPSSRDTLGHLVNTVKYFMDVSEELPDSVSSNDERACFLSRLSDHHGFGDLHQRESHARENGLSYHEGEAHVAKRRDRAEQEKNQLREYVKHNPDIVAEIEDYGSPGSLPIFGRGSKASTLESGGVARREMEKMTESEVETTSVLLFADQFLESLAGDGAGGSSSKGDGSAWAARVLVKSVVSSDKYKDIDEMDDASVLKMLEEFKKRASACGRVSTRDSLSEHDTDLGVDEAAGVLVDGDSSPNKLARVDATLARYGRGPLSAEGAVELEYQKKLANQFDEYDHDKVEQRFEMWERSKRGRLDRVLQTKSDIEAAVNAGASVDDLLTTFVGADVEKVRQAYGETPEDVAGEVIGAVEKYRLRSDINQELGLDKMSAKARQQILEDHIDAVQQVSQSAQAESMQVTQSSSPNQSSIPALHRPKTKPRAPNQIQDSGSPPTTLRAPGNFLDNFGFALGMNH